MAKVRQDVEGKKIMPQDNEAPKRIQNILEFLRACLASRYRYKIYVQSCQEDVIIERT